ncbi:phosphotransferase enzyme family protein [bacterium BMS3Abin02]|nr:phosphotransferase enzyme family protein [bacterium BMS3Abin02]GBE21212.1 phosphotransferase enzyme family protein [bacterium BMS3Bbin01]HDH26038.1 hypothetical protein [Actinomycetota bacterium]HDK46056.1 hypothetical protein [Actinomycetota bacterium]
MQPKDIALGLADGGSANALSTGTNSVFRVRTSDGHTWILKVYGSSSYQRRERRAYDALSGLPGLPTVLEWGSTGDSYWVRLADAGKWTLAALPGNPKAAKQAGTLLRGLHEANHSQLSNLEAGIDSDRMRTAIRGNFARLERYRGRLRIPSSVFESAVDLEFPSTGSPRASHSRPAPEAFVINDDGQVTLTGWTWATLAPPEWDYTFAYWQLSQRASAAVDAFSLGYGATIDRQALKSWFAFHISASLLRQVEMRDGRLEDLQPFVDHLVSAMG